MSATATLVATPDPEPRCTCGFQPTRARTGYQWVFRRDPFCRAHRGPEVQPAPRRFSAN